ncbi:MAG: adenylate/guanylate cyclase domain-containing protein [Actinomycetota bacterium]|nr:adenylate/guanylate cyclase domain-containing protein [Actinomycetota bacterium]
MSGADGRPDLTDALDALDTFLLDEPPSLTRVEVAEQAGVPLEVAHELWRLLGFPTQTDEAVAFTPADVQALRYSHDLMELGILSADRQAALVRTWGRSFARLAEWQTGLLTSVALESGSDPAETLAQMTQEVLPRVDALQSYVWRRHLVSAANRMLAVESPGSEVTDLAVVFVDIVGYTSRSKTLSESELVEWLEYFEGETLGLVVDRGSRIIKNIGDEVLLVADDVTAAADVALEMTRRGQDDDDRFPGVRAGIAYGPVVNRLGDVFGPTVNVAARLTSVARPGTVVVDHGAYEALSGRSGDDEDADSESGADETAYSLRRIRRVSVKGYSRLQAWALRGPANE